jgi:superfamily II DNA or RNA helicase
VVIGFATLSHFESMQISDRPCATPMLTDISLRKRYSSGRQNLLATFFTPCLAASLRYDRAVGFFSSTVFMLIGTQMADFARRGGRIRLICCPRLSPSDVLAIERGYEARTTVDSALQRELEEVAFDPVGQAATSLLATLIACGSLELKVAFRAGGSGIFHDKVGIFTDSEENQVSFTGSLNESWSGWSGAGNYEGFHAFSSWGDPERTPEDVEYFEALWRGDEPGLEVIPFPTVARDRLMAHADPDGLVNAEEQLREALERERGEQAAGRPRLRPHQTAVLADWERRGFRGLVEHATGSGKTLTGLTAVRTALDAGHAVLILVPAVALLEQWQRQLIAYFGTGTVLLVGGGHDEWRNGAVLRNFLSPGRRRIVLATMDTAASDEFTVRVNGIHPLCLLVDEVHNIGSLRRRFLLQNTDADWRLGLSATWQREGDPTGTTAIFDFFEHVLEPVYSLADAIADGHLCQYRYVVHELALTPVEQEQWLAETKRIGQALGRTQGEFTESVQQLLIRRARIVKGATAKTRLASDVLADQFQDGDAWLVYCDDTSQLRRVRQAIESRGLACMEYHRQASGDESEALAEFERSGGILLAIKCLDEGIDIPRIDHALILASSTTRRQFIQRRGRVLRTADRKWRAEIHDVIVSANGFDDPAAASFVRTELARAREFAASAIDSSAAQYTLDRLERELGMASGSFAAPDSFEVSEGDNT